MARWTIAYVSATYRLVMWQIENAVTDVLALDIDSGFLCNGRPCTCPINGKDFVRDPSVKVRAGDSIIIISADAGG